MGEAEASLVVKGSGEESVAGKVEVRGVNYDDLANSELLD